MNISSNSLFHFTPAYSNLCGIITNGLKYSSLKEELPYSGFEGSVFSIPGIIQYLNHTKAVCFCDIPLKLVQNHRNQYGKYILGFKKEWAIRNGITPVRYIHYHSPDINNDAYRILKDYMMQFQRFDFNPFSFFMNVVKDIDGIEPISSEEFEALPQSIQNTVTYINAAFLQLSKYMLFTQGYLRAYDGNWRDRSSGIEITKNFYDEREWRAIQLGESNFLKFNFEDISHIFVETIDEKNEIIEGIIKAFNLVNNDKEVWYKVKIWSDFINDF